MDDPCIYARRPVAFIIRYVRARFAQHSLILTCVLAAVGCSVATQYGVKSLVDVLTSDPSAGADPWPAFGLLLALISADNLLWRVAGWGASHTFVLVTGDLRRDLFHHLAGHSQAYFADRLPGTLTSRITATANACFTVENMFIWNVLPPCAATVLAIGFVATVSVTMSAVLAGAAALTIVTMIRIAAAGRPLHHDFAEKAAVVDGEIADVLGNMMLVKAFGNLDLELTQFRHTVGHEMDARYRSLLYLERMRLLHAIVVIALIVGLLAWAIALWRQNIATTGDVVLICTLGLMVLHATRDLALALVDVTQHIARLSEALSALLVPHDLRDHPSAAPLVGPDASIAFENVSFGYPDGRTVLSCLDLCIDPGERVGIVGESGGGKSTLFALLQRFHDVGDGRILIGGQDISRVTEVSLRRAIAVVPQDISLFHRTLMENIRYGRPDADDEEVWRAAVAARCHDFIAAMPRGLHTMVGERGAKLSGGQRQRIALARAFLKDAPILLLDEATSALDHVSEAAIQDALARLMPGRTVLAIAHRLSTLRSFDRVVVLDAGKVVCNEPPSKLIGPDGRYAGILENSLPRRAEANVSP
jgi:ATP-binding cassette subfamily B protein